MKNQIRDFVKQRKIVNVMIINQFLNSVSKTVKNRDDDDLINVIFRIYSKEKKVYESNEKDVVIKKISTNEIIQILKLLQLYEKQQDERDCNFIACLKKHAKLMDTNMTFKQTSITSYFT